MLNKIPLTDLKNSSALFLDFMNRVQDDSIDSVSNNIPEILSHNHDRKILISAIENTSCNFSLSPKQAENLELLKLSNTLTVVSGQQAGFLSGSLYTLFKSLDTITVSEELAQKNPGFNFVPVFWIEDNDNDSAEAAGTYFFDSEYNPNPFKLNFAHNKIVAETYLHSEDNAVIDSVCANLKNYPNGSQAIDMIKESYQTGKSWSEAFCCLMNKIMGHTGILFLSAGKLLETGIFRDLVIDELSNPSRSFNSIAVQNSKLSAKGYHLQAQASDINLFYHDGGERHRIDAVGDGYSIKGEYYSKSDLIIFAGNNPEKFSPKVLLRPVFQDYVLPTAVYIAGAGEIAYHSQIDGLYKDFNVTKPALLMRTTATVIDKKISRYLSKIEVEPDYFWYRFQDIERELSASLLGSRHEQIFNEFRNDFQDKFAEIEKYLLSIDSQLDRTINGARVKISEQVDQLDKKAHSAAKRTNDELLYKYKLCSSAVLPLENLQERVICGLNFIAQDENFIDKILELSSIDRFHHHFLSL